jgi:DNA-binding CsgD family transcriptional regulator
VLIAVPLWVTVWALGFAFYDTIQANIIWLCGLAALVLLNGNLREALFAAVFYFGINGGADCSIAFCFQSLGRNLWTDNTIYDAGMYFYRLIMEIVGVLWAYLYYRIMRKLSGKLLANQRFDGVYITTVATIPVITVVLTAFVLYADRTGTPMGVNVFGAVISALFVVVTAILFAVYIKMRTAYEAHLFAEQIAATPPVWSKEAGLSAVFIAKYGITPREAEVIALVLQGKTNKEIAIALDFAEDTAKKHTKNIYSKVGVSGRFALQSLLRG